MSPTNPINETTKYFTASTARISTPQKTDAFENALSNALDRTEAPEMPPASPHALEEVASIDLTILSSSDIISEKTDKLLGLLDSYASKLENPNMSLKTIAPVLEKIKDHATTLLKETEQLTDTDAGLKKIAAQTIVTAQTEYLKFQRGDYLS